MKACNFIKNNTLLGYKPTTLLEVEVYNLLKLRYSIGVSLEYYLDFKTMYVKVKVVLFLEIGREKIFLSLTCPHSRLCFRIYIFSFEIKKTTKK